jgi:hypothetical protein
VALRVGTQIHHWEEGKVVITSQSLLRQKSLAKQREFTVRPQIATGMLQPTFISPARACVAVNDGFRLLPGSQSQIGVFGHLSEIASVRSTNCCFAAPAVGILCFIKAREIPTFEYVFASDGSTTA